MAKEFKIEISKRESQGKQAMKRLRREGKIPGVFYEAGSQSSVSFEMDYQQIEDAIKSGARIFNISVGGKKQIVIFKSVQYHPVTDQITHIDLYGVRMDQAISIKVPISLIGTAKGVQSEGGILNQILSEVEVKCLPSDIPDSIDVDVSDLGIGDNLNIGSIELDDKFDISLATESVIVSVTMPMKEEEVVDTSDEDEFMDSDEETSDGEKSDDSKEGSDDSKKDEGA